MVHGYWRWHIIIHDILGTKTSKGLQWGEVKGLELRAVPILRHFVVEGIYLGKNHSQETSYFSTKGTRVPTLDRVKSSKQLMKVHEMGMAQNYDHQNSMVSLILFFFTVCQKRWVHGFLMKSQLGDSLESPKKSHSDVRLPQMCTAAGSNCGPHHGFIPQNGSCSRLDHAGSINHGSLNDVPMFHITQPWMVLMVYKCLLDG